LGTIPRRDGWSGGGSPVSKPKSPKQKPGPWSGNRRAWFSKKYTEKTKSEENQKIATKVKTKVKTNPRRLEKVNKKR
jgi:hypothetical protein